MPICHRQNNYYSKKNVLSAKTLCFSNIELLKAIVFSIYFSGNRIFSYLNRHVSLCILTSQYVCDILECYKLSWT